MRHIFNALTYPVKLLKRSSAFVVAAITLTLVFNAPGGAYYLNTAAKNVALYSLYQDFSSKYGRIASFDTFKGDLPFFLMNFLR
jgi:hypothetical protein